MIVDKNFPIDISELTKFKNKKSRLEHLKNSCSKSTIPGSIMEFGVFQGKSINVLSEIFKDEIVYGFDSFEGLPENWQGPDRYYQKEYFSVEKITVNDNVRLIKGWFDSSIPEFLENNQIKNLKFLHIDCDLYTSTKTVLKNLNHLIIPGTVIVFDEFYNWKHPDKKFDHGELQAFNEWVNEFDRQLEFLDKSGSCQISFLVRI